MTCYVAIERVKGMNNFVELVERMQARGYWDKVEYSAGGWQDSMLFSVQPHLKFEDEEDAVAYILTFGGEISKEIPIKLT